MTELRRIVWDWEPVAARLRAVEPLEGFLFQLACRPIAADRQADGKLTLVIGCWLDRARRLLAEEDRRLRLSHRLNALFDDRLQLIVTRWPGGELEADDEDAALLDQALADLGAGIPPDKALPSPAYANPPNPVGDLGPIDEAILAEARKCEGALDRLLFAELVKRGARPVCQFTILNYRLDLALPDRRIAADVDRWQPRTGRRPNEIRTREAALEDEGWTYLTFAGAQVLQDPAGCVKRLLSARPGKGPAPPSGGPLSIGSFRRPPHGRDGRSRGGGRR